MIPLAGCEQFYNTLRVGARSGRASAGASTQPAPAPGGLQVSRRRSPEARRRETASPESIACGSLVSTGGLVQVSNRSSHAEKH